MSDLVEIRPGAIEFFSEYDVTLTSTITIRNISDHLLAYKIKTTAPKRYLVRPSQGLIPTFQDQNVEIILQPLLSDNVPKNDRFLVQLVKYTDHQDETLTREFWINVPKSAITEKRLSVRFLDKDLMKKISSAGNDTDDNLNNATSERKKIVTSGGDLGNSDSSRKHQASTMRKQPARLTEPFSAPNSRVPHESRRDPAVAEGSQGRTTRGLEMWRIVLLAIFAAVAYKMYQLFKEN